MKRRARASRGKSKRSKPTKKPPKKTPSGRSKRMGKPAAKRKARKTVVKRKTRKPAAKRKTRKTAVKRKARKPAVKRKARKMAVNRKASKGKGRKPASKLTGTPTGRPARTASVRKTSKPRGLKAGSDSRAEQLRAMLESKRSEIMQEIRRARQDGIDADRTSFAEVGDLVSASVEKERAFEFGEIGVNALREIDSALAKLKEGTYGICEACSKPIGLRRLKAMPSAGLCISCKSKEEASGR